MLTTFCSILLAAIPQTTLDYMPPMDQIYHPVSTANPDAQKYFNKGLTYIYAYNHDVAYSSFEKAAQLDPNLAMAYWGMALALGQNVNEDITPEREVRCYKLMQSALKLAPNSSKNEQDYIQALKVRYVDNPSADFVPLRAKYREAMKKVVEAYPEDLDAATLYSESILNLNPWKWWTPQGKPTEGIYEAVDLLEHVLNRNPDHIGANHFYIHAFEESPFPERALMSAHRLETLLPESGHLLHMPCHIFLLVGDYESALKTNLKALAADRQYIKEHGLEGGYPVHYFGHNLYIMMRIHMLIQDFENAYKTAQELAEFMRPHVLHHTNIQHFMYTPYEVLLYFHKWEEILKYQPLIKDSPIVDSYQHFSKAMAQAYLGNLTEAQHEKELMLQSKKNIPPNEEIANNPASKVFELAEIVLNATFSEAQNNYAESIQSLNKAIEMQDRLNYDEPPAWYLPLRESLGAIQLKQKQWPEAEKTFSQALKKLRRNGRLLYGLSLSLKAQKKEIDAYWIEREAAEALKLTPKPLTLNHFQGFL